MCGKTVSKKERGKARMEGHRSLCESCIRSTAVSWVVGMKNKLYVVQDEVTSGEPRVEWRLWGGSCQKRQGAHPTKEQKCHRTTFIMQLRPPKATSYNLELWPGSQTWSRDLRKKKKPEINLKPGSRCNLTKTHVYYY